MSLSTAQKDVKELENKVL